MSRSLVGRKAVVSLMRDVRGLTGIEYALIAALIALVIVAGVAVAGGALGGLWTGIGKCMTSRSANCL